MKEKDRLDFMISFVIRVFLGWYISMAILGSLAFGWLTEPINMRPIESRMDLLFYCFILSLGVFALWQFGHYTIMVAQTLYKRFNRESVDNQERGTE